MSEHPDAELVRRDYEALANGDLESMRPFLDPGVVWHETGRAGHRCQPTADAWTGSDSIINNHRE